MVLGEWDVFGCCWLIGIGEMIDIFVDIVIVVVGEKVDIEFY